MLLHPKTFFFSGENNVFDENSLINFETINADYLQMTYQFAAENHIALGRIGSSLYNQFYPLLLPLNVGNSNTLKKLVNILIRKYKFVPVDLNPIYACDNLPDLQHRDDLKIFLEAIALSQH
ncbi:hypothetical protein ACT4R9_09360 [Ornithobacterium rhinotracheale]|uniref:hypothetical protein n=1 Tax=Ornithobacterium rhinotracheale TaxID=28251 RepID=UPI003FA438B7